MTTIETWDRLSQNEQLAQWRSFIEALDAGDAGYHPWRPVLMPLWDLGETPELIDDEQLARREAELAEDALWAAQRLPAFSLHAALGEPPF